MINETIIPIVEKIGTISYKNEKYISIFFEPCNIDSDIYPIDDFSETDQKILKEKDKVKLSEYYAITPGGEKRHCWGIKIINDQELNNNYPILIDETIQLDQYKTLYIFKRKGMEWKCFFYNESLNGGSDYISLDESISKISDQAMINKIKEIKD